MLDTIRDAPPDQTFRVITQIAYRSKEAASRGQMKSTSQSFCLTARNLADVEELEELTEEDITAACEEWLEVRSPIDMDGEWSLDYNPLEAVSVSPFSWNESGTDYAIEAYNNDEAYLVALVEEDLYVRVNWRESEDGFVDIHSAIGETLDELLSMSDEDIEAGFESTDAVEARVWLEVTGEWLGGDLTISAFSWEESGEVYDVVAYDNDEDFLVVLLPEGVWEDSAVHIRVNWQIDESGETSLCVDMEVASSSDSSIEELSERTTEESCSSDVWTPIG